MVKKVMSDVPNVIKPSAPTPVLRYINMSVLQGKSLSNVHIATRATEKSLAVSTTLILITLKIDLNWPNDTQ